MTTIFLMHILSTAAMFGAIWYIHVVHYPLYGLVDEKSFAFYHIQNVKRTACVVIPLMLLEVGTGVGLILGEIGGEDRWLKSLLGFSLGLIGVAWFSTLMIQIPIHLQLLRGKKEIWIKRLWWSNWIRVVCWTTRLGLLFWIFELKKLSFS